MSDKQKEAAAFAAERRADYVRALEEERDAYKRLGRTDRAKDVEAELKRVQKDAPAGRKAPDADES